MDRSTSASTTAATTRQQHHPPTPLRLNQTSIVNGSSSTSRAVGNDHAPSSPSASSPQKPKRTPPPPLRLRSRSRERATTRRMPGGDTAAGVDLSNTTSPPASAGWSTPGFANTGAGGRPRSMTPSQSGFHLMSPVRSDLETFARHCKAWFFGQDATAGKAMTATLGSLPPAQKPTYLKLQASIRSAYHSSLSIRRLQEYRALVSSTTPGASLVPANRSFPSSRESRRERLTKFTRFVATYCGATTPGTKQFFEGLYTVLRLQGLPEGLGGAGGRRIEWEVDDAVFLESGGKEFTQDAIGMLKGVLGFEERMKSAESDDPTAGSTLPDYQPPPDDDSSSDQDTEAPQPANQSIPLAPQAHSHSPSPPPRPSLPLRPRPHPSPYSESSPSLPGRSTATSHSHPQSQPQPQYSYASSQSTHSFLANKNRERRDRASSDPFSDPGRSSSPGIAGHVSSSYISRTRPLSGIGEDEGDAGGRGIGMHSRHQSQPMLTANGPPPLASEAQYRGTASGRSTPDYGPGMPVSASRGTLYDFDLDDIIYDSSASPRCRAPSQADLDLLHTAQLRVWTFPSYIVNPELTSLLAAFPSSVTKGTVPRFPVAKKPKHPDNRSRLAAIDLERGDENVSWSNEEEGVVKKGTGRMWIGERVRDDGWRGSLWARFVLWLKGLFF